MDGTEPDRVRGRGPKPGSAAWWAERAPDSRGAGGPKVRLIIFFALLVVAVGSVGLWVYQALAVQPVGAAIIPSGGGSATLSTELQAGTTYSIEIDSSPLSCSGCRMTVEMELTAESGGEPLWSGSQFLVADEDDDSAVTSYFVGTYAPGTTGTYDLSYSATVEDAVGDWTITLVLKPVLASPDVLFGAMFLSILGVIGASVLLARGRKRGE